MDVRAMRREADMVHVRIVLLGGYGTVLEEWGVWTGNRTMSVDNNLCNTVIVILAVPRHTTCASHPWRLYAISLFGSPDPTLFIAPPPRAIFPPN